MSVNDFNPDMYPVLWVQSGRELCARINFLFARKWLSQFVLRLTGGCELIDEVIHKLAVQIRK